MVGTPVAGNVIRDGTSGDILALGVRTARAQMAPTNLVDLRIILPPGQVKYLPAGAACLRLIASPISTRNLAETYTDPHND